MEYVIFGAGINGEKMLNMYGGDKVSYFVDNDKNKIGKIFHGKKIFGVDELKNACDKRILISAGLGRFEIQKQLCDLGIYNFSIINEFAFDSTETTEKEWINKNDSDEIKEKRKNIEDIVNRYLKEKPLFELIHIETINRCNGTCEFCPANCHIKTMEKQIMTMDLFCKIVDELESLNYDGKFALFCNNEPFLDPFIYERAMYAKQKLKEAHIYLYSNGLVLKPDMLEKIYPYLDEIQINNYNKVPELNDNCSKLVAYCDEHAYLKEKMTINLRRIDVILTSRAGKSPNRHDKVSYAKDTCILPFRQMIVRPDGKLSLCCCDALGMNTLGDISKESLEDAWYGEKYLEFRAKIANGRENWDSCKYCDSFII